MAFSIGLKNTAEECQLHCQNTTGCKYFVYEGKPKRCQLKSFEDDLYYSKGTIAGPKYCGKLHHKIVCNLSNAEKIIFPIFLLSTILYSIFLLRTWKYRCYVGCYPNPCCGFRNICLLLLFSGNFRAGTRKIHRFQIRQIKRTETNATKIARKL